MFQSLCGTQTYKNIVVLTTFWDQVEPEVGARREAQLQSNFFKEVIQGGARFLRHNRTPKSAAALLSYVLNLVPVTTQIQIEMGKEGKSLVDTAAGGVQQEEIERVVAKHKKEIADLKAELETIKQSNTAARRELEEERAKLRQQLARWESEKAELKEGIDKERSARQKLEADIATERENREKWRQEQERKFDTRNNTINKATQKTATVQPTGRGLGVGYSESDQISVPSNHDTSRSGKRGPQTNICWEPQRIPVRAVGTVPTISEVRPAEGQNVYLRYLQLLCPHRDGCDVAFRVPYIAKHAECAPNRSPQQGTSQKVAGKRPKR